MPLPFPAAGFTSTRSLPALDGSGAASAATAPETESRRPVSPPAPEVAVGHAPAQDVAPRGEELRLAVEGERDGSAEIAASFTAAEQTLRIIGEGSVRRGRTFGADGRMFGGTRRARLAIGLDRSRTFLGGKMCTVSSRPRAPAPRVTPATSRGSTEYRPTSIRIVRAPPIDAPDLRSTQKSSR